MQFDLKIEDNHAAGTSVLKALTFKGQCFNREITGQMADPELTQTGLTLARQVAQQRGLTIALPGDNAKAEWE